MKDYELELGSLWADLTFVTNITNIISGEKSSCGETSAFPVWQLWGNWKFLHMWRNFSTIDGVLLQFMPFCRKICYSCCFVVKFLPQGLASHWSAKTTFTFHFSINDDLESIWKCWNREMKSESGFSLAIASQPFKRFHMEKNWAQKYICGEKMTNIRSALLMQYLHTT